MITEDFDADDVLRDLDEKFVEEEETDGDAREMNFGHDDIENFKEIADDLDQFE